MIELRVQPLAVARLQSFDFNERRRDGWPIRILYSNVQSDKRLFDFRFWHF
jgi:hypothetical protein